MENRSRGTILPLKEDNGASYGSGWADCDCDGDGIGTDRDRDSIQEIR